MYEGESHVPKETGDGYAHYMRELRFNCGKLVHGLWSMWVVSTGWVLYLMLPDCTCWAFQLDHRLS